ncbi:MAG: RNA polymerase factor sigma-32 [bacterium]|nr:RNA polymerase factor sigma-32 [bacterium]
MTYHKSKLPAVSGKKPLETVDPLKRYVQEISQYPFLSAAEELELARRFKETGDRDAAKKLVMSHLRLVVKIAREYKAAYGRLFDLVQEGNLGLMKAVKKFDPERGVRLASYAAWWIRSYILKHILDNFRLIKIGTTQAQRRIFFNLMKEKERIEKMGFTPDTKQLAAALKVKPEEVEEMEGRLAKADMSLDAPVGDDGGKRHLDLLEGGEAPLDESLGQAQFQNILEQKLKEFATTLNDRDKKIFRERLIAEVPKTLQALGDEFGISRERARQLEERIKTKLKTFFEAEGLKVEEHF